MMSLRSKDDLTMHAQLGRTLLGGVLALALLAGCGGASDDDAVAGAGEAASQSTDTAPADVASTASIFETELPIPAGQTFFDVSDTPANWPAIIGVPNNLDTSQGFFVDQAAAAGMRQLGGTFVYDGTPDTAFGDGVIERLQAAGFMVVRDELGPGEWAARLTRGNETVSITNSTVSTVITITG